jgi:hypothetical protein
MQDMQWALLGGFGIQNNPAATFTAQITVRRGVERSAATDRRKHVRNTKHRICTGGQHQMRSQSPSLGIISITNFFDG